MGKVIQVYENEVRTLVGLLQTVMMELGQVREALSANGHGDMVLCSDVFAGQLYQSITALEGDLWSADGPANPPFGGVSDRLCKRAE